MRTPAPQVSPPEASRIRHVVWDFNGTLIDDIPLINEASNAAFADLGLPVFTDEEYRLHYSRPIQAFYERLVGRLLTEAEWTRLEAVYHDHYTRNQSVVPLVSGVHEVLAEVEALGWTQSVCSMSPHEGLVSRVGELGLSHHFVRIEGARGPGGGTKAALFSAHIAALGLDSAAVVMIGDSMDDASAAVEAGAQCVLLDSGIHHEAVLAGADVRVATTLAEALHHAVTNERRRPD